MLSTSLGIFFWMSTIYIYAKYQMDLPVYMDGLFLIVVMMFMYGINVAIMQGTCGTYSTWTIVQATFVPWVAMFGSMLVSLVVFPSWKGPFSNTFG